MPFDLLQRGFNPPPPGANPANNPAFMGGFLVGGIAAFVCILIVLYGPYIFMLIKAMQALQAVRPRNRSMAPGLVWLGLIPCVNVVVNFLIVLKTSESLKNEYDDRRLRFSGDHGKQLGMTYAVIVVLNVAISGLSRGLSGGVAGNNGPVVAVMLALGCASLLLLFVQVVLPIVYGLKLQQSTARLIRDDDRYGGGDDRDDDDDFDDEPKPRPKKRKPVEDDFDEPAPRRKPRKKPDDDFEEFDEPKGGR